LVYWIDLDCLKYGFWPFPAKGKSYFSNMQVYKGFWMRVFPSVFTISPTKWQAGYKLYALAPRYLFPFQTQPFRILEALWLVGGPLPHSLIFARITASCISWIAFKQHLCIFNVTAEMMRWQPRIPIPPPCSLCWQRVCRPVHLPPRIYHPLTPWLMHFAVSRKFHSRFTEAKSDNSSKSLDNVPGICVGSARHEWYIVWIIHILE